MSSDALTYWETVFRNQIREIATPDDPAHDLLHFERVVRSAKLICTAERARPEVVIPAAWLHDMVVVPKNDPRRSQASKLSAKAAIEFLRASDYPNEYLDDIFHAIEAHSFSANIECRTLEAQVVQDADRLDGLGAIGIARCFTTAGLLRRPFYSEEDPFCESRNPQDRIFTLDHFYQKLFKTAETLQTATGRSEGQRRAAVMRSYLRDLEIELGTKIPI